MLNLGLHRTVFMLVLLTYLTPFGVTAQGLQPERILTLGDTEGPGFVAGAPRDLVMLSNGTILLATNESRLAQAYGPSGEFLGPVGSEGQGPGEFLRVTQFLKLPGDSVLVADTGNRRLTLLDEDLDFVRSYSMPSGSPYGMVGLWPDRVLINQSVPTPSRVGFPLHRVSFEGQSARIVRSFGAGGDLRPGQSATLIMRMSEPDESGGVWATPVTEVSPVLWDSEGAPVRELRVARSWFTPQGEAMGSLGAPGTPPPSRVTAIYSRENEVWTFVRVASASWEDGWINVDPESREARLGDIRVPALFDTMVVIIDALTGEILAEQRLPELVTGVLSDGTVVTHELGELDRTLVGLWSLRNPR